MSGRRFTVDVSVDDVDALVDPASEAFDDYTWTIATHMLSLTGMSVLDDGAPVEQVLGTVKAATRDSWDAQHVMNYCALQAVQGLVNDGLVTLTCTEDGPEAHALAREQIARIADEVVRAVHTYSLIRFTLSTLVVSSSQVKTELRELPFPVELL